MIKFKPYYSLFLTLQGFFFLGLGIYFIFLRPPILQEDARYINLSLSKIQNKIPGLASWLQKVFWVMGGYMLSVGILTVYMAQTSFRNRSHGAFLITLVTGIASIASMTVINFMLGSDFKWILLVFNVPWVIALFLYSIHNPDV